MSDHGLRLQAIARVISPYREKFGIPRQAGLVEAARGWLEMAPEFAHPEAFEGLEGFERIWVIFGFHACEGRYRLRVRPPRLGGNREVGVFASRSPFRPNNLGLSLLGFEGIEQVGGRLRLRVSGMDLLYGTPVYDIKPYLPYADAHPEAAGGFAAQPPLPVLTVHFSEGAETVLREQPALRELIVQTLALDPRPAYRKGADRRRYGMYIEGFDVRWRVEGERAEVEAIVPVGAEDAPGLSASD